VITLGEIVLIHDLKRQGLSVSAIARKLVCYSQLSTAQFSLTINNTLTITPANPILLRRRVRISGCCVGRCEKCDTLSTN